MTKISTMDCRLLGCCSLLWKEQTLLSHRVVVVVVIFVEVANIDAMDPAIKIGIVSIMIGTPALS